jgi:CBS domain-containing protein
MVMEASDMMTREVYVVGPEDTLSHVRNLFIKKRISRVVVFDEKPVGVLTDTDITHSFLEERRGIDEVRVHEAMSKSLVTAVPTDSPQKLAKLMLDRSISGVPITEDGQVVGIVTKSDLVKYFSENLAGKAKVRDVMSSDVVTIKEFQSIFHASRTMEKHRVKKLVVVKDRSVVGILTERDLSLATFGTRPSRMVFYKKTHGMMHRKVRVYPLTVGDLMQTNVLTVAPGEDAATAARRMLRRRVGSLIVEDAGVLHGIVTKTDYLRFLTS